MRTCLMLCKKYNLPNEIVNYIMSYSFPNVKEQHKSVMIQINYNFKEFNYLRHLPLNHYYKFYESEFIYFILNRIYDKMELNNKNIERNNEDFIEMRKLWGGYYDEHSGVNYIIDMSQIIF